MTLTFNLRRAMAVTHTHTKYESQRSIDSRAKSRKKRTENDGRTRPIALPFSLTQSVTSEVLQGSALRGCKKHSNKNFKNVKKRKKT